LTEIRVHEIAFDEATDLIDALDPASGLFAGGAVYRGQADSTWGLLPSVFRDNVPYLLSERFFPRDNPVYGSQVKLEIELLWLFISRANEAGLIIPGDSDQVREYIDSIRNNKWWVAEQKNLRSWPPRELIPALSLAQHHGVPTRLLDWTYSPYTAIYFAAEGAARNEKRSGRLAVWVCFLDETRRFVKSAPSLEIARPSNAFNQNLRYQRGCLMVWRKGAKPDQAFDRVPLEVLLSEEAERAGVTGPPIFLKFTAPSTESGALLQLLSLRQVDGATLFPGFDGVARVVRERPYWQGYRGTGAKRFEEKLHKRGNELRERIMGNVPFYSVAQNENDDNPYGWIGGLLSATRQRIDAGDYDPMLSERIVQFEKMFQELHNRNEDPKLLHEITQVLAALKDLQ